MTPEQLEYYESRNHKATSYNGKIGEFIRHVRHYRTEVPLLEFNNGIQNLKILQKELQDIDAVVAEPPKNYLQQVMDILDDQELLSSAGDLSMEGSYNELLATLVVKVRYYRMQVPIDEFKEKIPQLLSSQKVLQIINNSIPRPEVNYMNSIMRKLDLVDGNDPDQFD